MHKAVHDKLLQEKSTRTKRPLPEENDESEQNPDNKRAKLQTTLGRFGGHKSVSQASANDLIVKYVVNEMRPLHTVERDSFKELVSGLNPAVTVMCRKTLREIIASKFDHMQHNLKYEFSSTLFICTTADIWSSCNRSFLGMMAHWFSSDATDNFHRKSAALACLRFKGKHSYDRIASGISQIHAQYNIEEKVQKTCTDNGSNMIKAFVESDKYKLQLQYAATADCDNSGDETDADDESVQDDDAGQLDNLNEVIEEQSGRQQDNDGADVGVTLPPHMRCCSHTLNLVATRDAERALSEPAYKKIYRLSMAKATAIWNATSRSTKAADAVFDIVKRRFIVPCPTRWNSYYEAVKCIVQAENHLKDICAVLNLPQLLHQEVAFLREYLSLMEPLARALDVLQGDQNACLGFVLPTLKLLKTKLNGVPLSLDKPLHEALLDGINTRFSHVFNDTEFLLAAVSHPKFKLYWIDDAELKVRCSMLLLKAVQDETASASTTHQTSMPTMDSASNSVHSDTDFFSDLRHNEGQEARPHLQYLQDPTCELSMLNKHKSVKSIFLRYNSTIPSSAPVERLFSTGAIVLCKRRNRLHDDLFEKLLLLKINKNFW